jgi:Protein of unknown function (DUF2934)
LGADVALRQLVKEMEMDEDMERVSSKAYEIWEQEGKPDGRALDHWLEAERHVLGQTGDGDQQDRKGPGPSANEGEGNRTAARQHNEAQQRFVRSGKVENKAREAQKAIEGDEGKELRKAELVGRQRAAEKGSEEKC